jgi:hypothetical protein
MIIRVGPDNFKPEFRVTVTGKLQLELEVQQLESCSDTRAHSECQCAIDSDKVGQPTPSPSRISPPLRSTGPSLGATVTQSDGYVSI